MNHLLVDDPATYSGGYGVPYGANGYAANGAPGFYPQQGYNPGNFAYATPYQVNTYAQAQYGAVVDPANAGIKSHRRHHRHHRHHAANGAPANQGQAAPE